MRTGKQRANFRLRTIATLSRWWWRRIRILFVILAAATTLPAQDEQAPGAVTFNALINFDGANGSNVTADLVQGADGNRYGISVLGGA